MPSSAARETARPRRRLHLDQAAVAGDHRVQVHLGGRVLLVVEVEARLTSTMPADTAATESNSGSPRRPSRSSILSATW